MGNQNCCCHLRPIETKSELPLEIKESKHHSPKKKKKTKSKKNQINRK